MKLGMGEILAKVVSATSKQEKIHILQKEFSIPFGQLLKMAFDENLEWVLPTEDPPFKPSDYLDGQNMLYGEAKRLYLFHRGGRDDLSELKRQTLFVQLLESIDKEDAKFVLAVRNKKLPEQYNGVTKELINEAYPGLLVY